MPVSLIPLLARLRRFRPGRAFVTYHPRYEQILRADGLTSADAFLELSGEVVSGHADRHVVEVRAGDMKAFLKREHRVPWMTRLRNLMAGFGASSLAAREGAVLDELSQRAVPVPQWLAYGEDGRGRAFLLLRRVAGRDLRAVLCRGELDNGSRDELARALGQAIAAVHRAGFDAPDLSAKHVLVRRDNSIVLLDWPRGRRGRKPNAIKSLAALHATVAPELVTVRERLIALRAYRQFVLVPTLCAPPVLVPTLCVGTPLATLCVADIRRQPPAPQSGGSDVPTQSVGTSMKKSRLAPMARKIMRHAERLHHRRSIREQIGQHFNRPEQRLRWVDGEQLCVTRPLWSALRGVMPDWLVNAAREVVAWPSFTSIVVPNIGSGWLFQLPAAPRCRIWLGRLVGRPIRPRAVRQAGLAFRLARHGVPVSQVLAFGGREDGSGFLLVAASSEYRELREWLALPRPGRNAFLYRLGDLLRRCHEAGCRGVRGDILLAELQSEHVRIRLVPDGLLKACSRVSHAQAIDDIQQLAYDLRLRRRTEILRMIRGYLGGRSITQKDLRLASKVLGLSVRRAA